MVKTKRSGQKEDMSKLELQEMEKNQPLPRARGVSNRTANEIQGQKTHRSSIAEKNVLAANRPNYPIMT
jgi:hypothetical protein